MERDPRELPKPPPLPQRAAIYIAPDGNVTFGALFEGLVPVAQALAANSLSLSGPAAPDRARCARADKEP